MLSQKRRLIPTGLQHDALRVGFRESLNRTSVRKGQLMRQTFAVKVRPSTSPWGLARPPTFGEEAEL